MDSIRKYFPFFFSFYNFFIFFTKLIHEREGKEKEINDKIKENLKKNENASVFLIEIHNFYRIVIFLHIYSF